MYSFSSPATSALAREFRGLTYGTRARGLFNSAANLVNSFGVLDELSAATANCYVGQGVVELAFQQQALTLEAKDCAVPLPKKLADEFFHGIAVHLGALDIFSLQAAVFQLLKTTHLFPDNFTVSEIKAVKRIEEARGDSKLNTFSALLELVTEIESAGDLRAHPRLWNLSDGSSGGGGSSGFIGSSTSGGRSGGGNRDGGSSSPGVFTPKYTKISPMDYPGKAEFVAASISREDFARVFDYIDSGTYCSQTWRVKSSHPRLETTSVVGDNHPNWVMGTFGALKVATRVLNYDSKTKNPSYIAELARPKALPFKPHPASPGMTDAEEAEAKKMYREL